MRPQDVVEALVSAIKQSDELPSSTNYVGYEPNIDTEAIKLPLLEATVQSETRLSEHNTDFQGYITDDNGNQVGRVFDTLYQLTVDIRVWAAQGSKYDPDDLGDSVYCALYEYDSTGPDRSLGDDIFRIRIGDGSPDEDFTTSPTLRRWSQTVDVWAYATFTTDEEYIVNVVPPADGDFTDTSATGRIDNG